jgi:hypothetical protein
VTPQSAFCVLMPIRRDAENDLAALLDGMNRQPGQADPRNAVIPFGAFDRLHFARLCILRDNTVGDAAAYGLSSPPYPTYLALLGDVDESADSFIEELAAGAQSGLSKLFSYCEGFAPSGDVLAFMRRHRIGAAAAYVNWHGRTMLQIREEAAIREAVENFLDANSAVTASATPLKLHALLRRFLSDEIASGRLTMTPDAPTRWSWLISNALSAIVPVLLLILFAPVAIVAGAILLLLIRRQELHDPEICPRVDPAYRERIAYTEDRDVTNVFSAVGTLKPGLVRRVMSIVGLLILSYAVRHIYGAGRLARVRTIHFARWVWIDEKRRLAFMSNYDGSLESYMDDFINKAGFGLNFVFSNGIGYPKTSWLLADGCKDEQKFKNFLFRHQIYTNVWYNAHPGLTAVDLERNARIRAGLEAQTLTSAQADAWAALL